MGEEAIIKKNNIKKDSEQVCHHENKADNIGGSAQLGLWQPARANGEICPPSALRTLNGLFYILTIVCENKAGPVNHQVVLMEGGKSTALSQPCLKPLLTMLSQLKVKRL